MAHKYVYLFSEGNGSMRELLGGKGANLAEMTSLGLPVPQGFIVSTEACNRYYEDGEKIEQPYYNVKCAGMPERCKQLFIKSFTGITKEEEKDYKKEELEFLQTKRSIKDFKKGLVVPSKLLPKRIEGGIILVDTTYELR